MDENLGHLLLSDRDQVAFKSTLWIPYCLLALRSNHHLPPMQLSHKNSYHTVLYWLSKCHTSIMKKVFWKNKIRRNPYLEDLLEKGNKKSKSLGVNSSEQGHLTVGMLTVHQSPKKQGPLSVAGARTAIVPK